jgi:hypothetical protein
MSLGNTCVVLTTVLTREPDPLADDRVFAGNAVLTATGNLPVRPMDVHTRTYG